MAAADVLILDDPANGRTAATVERTTHEAMNALAEAAAAAGRDFAATPLQERITLCERFLDEIDRQSESIAADITRQMGKPISQSRAEVRTMAARARFMMEAAEVALADKLLKSRRGLKRYIEKVPVGVVLDIAAWNYPLLTAVNVVVPALLAGNAVILKHSSRTPLCASHFADAFTRAGAPRGLVAAMVADHEVTAALIKRPEIGYVAFTGSVEGGRQISRAAAARFIDLGLELGGKDGAYVRADADLETAAKAIAEGAFYNAGQSCCAVERVYAHTGVYEELKERLVDEARAWVPGDPMAEDTRLGALARPGAGAFISGQLEEAQAGGAKVLAGGDQTQVRGKGRYFQATVVTDAAPDSRLMREESFAPLVALAAVASDREAVERINDCELGLSASIWTKDLRAAQQLGKKLDVGTVLMNRCDYLDPALPWSGWKDSGKGLTLSTMGFDRMVRTRSFNLNTPAT